MERKEIEASFGSPLIAAGFKRKRPSSWYRQLPGALQVVNLQKSSFGNQYYINLACVPKGMPVEGASFPVEYKCPIRIRLTAAYPEQESRIERILDLENGALDASNRQEGFRFCAAELVLPFLESLTDAQQLRQVIGKGVMRSAGITKAAKEFLGLDPDC